MNIALVPGWTSVSSTNPITQHAGNVVFVGRLSDKTTRAIVTLHQEQGHDRQRDLSIDDFQHPIDSAGIRIQIRSSD
jgi:hypothetical protein